MRDQLSPQQTVLVAWGRQWAAIEKCSKELLPPAHAIANISADECLIAIGKKTLRMKIIDLRLGSYSEEKSYFVKIGRIQLGKTRALSTVSRVDVVEVAVRLIEGAQRGWKGGWVALIAGEESIDSAVEKWARSGEDAIEGEDIDGMAKRVGVQ